jgi:hypothetical protein
MEKHMVLLAQIPKTRRTPKAEVEVIIIRACLGRPVGCGEVQHLEIGQRVKVNEAESRQLVWAAGAALYVDADDDASSTRQFTLTKEALAAIEANAASLREREQGRAEDLAYQRAQRRQLIEKYGTA